MTLRLAPLGHPSARRRKREAVALFGALVLHGASFVWLSRSVPHAGAAEPDLLGVVDIDIEREPAPPADSVVVATEQEPGTRSRPSDSAPHRLANQRNNEETAVPEGPPAPEPSGAPFDLRGPTRLSLDQLGLAGRNVFLGGLPDESGAPRRPSPPEHNEAPGVDVSIRDALQEHDHAAGLDGAGAVVGAAEEVARENDAPLNSKAVFELMVDADGAITSVHVVDASTAPAAWERIAKSLVTSLRARKPVLRHGHAMVVTLEMTSRWQLPSGDSPGSPVGSSQGGLSFDVSDIGARPIRVVHARIVREKIQR